MTRLSCSHVNRTPKCPAIKLPRGPVLRALGTAVTSAFALLLVACAPSAPETVEGFWFFSYSGQGDAPSGEAFAYVTEDGTRLGGGIASNPLGGPLSGSRDGTNVSLTIRDVGGDVVVEVEGRLRGRRSSGSWTARGGAAAERSGSFEAEWFDEREASTGENPFLGTWNDFEDGGVTTLSFGEDFRLTGSEADLEFTGQYAFDPSRQLLGVYEADGASVHMEKLRYRFEGTDTVVLNGSVYRRQ